MHAVLQDGYMKPNFGYSIPLISKGLSRDPFVYGYNTYYKGFDRYATATTPSAVVGNTGRYLEPLQLESPLHTVSSTYPPRTNDTALIGPGDNLEKLALQHFGDASYASLIAEANGLLADSPVVPGQALIMPSLITTRFNARTISPYGAFASALLNQFSVRFTTPLPKEDDGFWSCMIQAVEIIVAVVVSVVTVGTGSAISAALIAMATDAAFQAINIMVLHIQNKFSVEEMLQAGLRAGLNSYFQAGLKSADLLTRLSTISRIVIIQQGAEIAMGLRKNIDLRAIVVAVAEQYVQYKVQGNFTSQAGQNFLNNATHTVLTGAATGRFDIENFVTYGIGTAIGNQIVENRRAANQTQEKISRDAQDVTNKQQQEQFRQNSRSSSSSRTSASSSRAEQMAYADGYDEDFEEKTPTRKTTSRTQTNKQQTLQDDGFTQDARRKAMTRYGFEDGVRNAINKQFAFNQQVEVEAETKMEVARQQQTARASTPHTFMDYVKALNNSAYIADLNNTMRAMVYEPLFEPRTTLARTWGAIKSDYTYLTQTPNLSALDIAKGNAALLLDTASAFGMLSFGGAATRSVAVGLGEVGVGLVSKAGFFGRGSRALALSSELSGGQAFATAGVVGSESLAASAAGAGLFGRTGVESLSINASRPSEVAWGYGDISARQSQLLTQLAEPGDYLQLHKSAISPTDLATLTAKTGNEFALFTLGSQRVIVRGTSLGLEIRDNLADKLLSQNWRWSAHTHPGLSDNVLMASGVPGDRQVLRLFDQSRSLILNSAGRRSIFDIENDYLVTKQSTYSSTFTRGY